MTLSKKKMDALVRMIAATRSDEIDCDACLAGLSAFAENELAGLPVPEAQRAVQLHLEQCPECEQEFRTLLEALRGCE